MRIFWLLGLIWCLGVNLKAQGHPPEQITIDQAVNEALEKKSRIAGRTLQRVYRRSADHHRAFKTQSST